METNIVEVTPIGDDGKAHSNEGINRISGSATRTSSVFINTAFVKDKAESQIVEESPTLHLEHADCDQINIFYTILFYKVYQKIKI